MLRGKACHLALVAAVSATVLPLPGAAFASLWPQETAGGAAEAVAHDHRRLATIRERLQRREAMQRALDGEIRALGEAEAALRVRREGAEETLQRARDRALELERRLDRLVPRLAARAEVVGGRREQAADALADLAGRSRQIEIDPATRARLLAVSPLMLERLRSADASLAGLRQQRDRIAAEHRAVLERAPALLAERQMLERERLLAQRRRDAQLAELERVEKELAALRREEQVLAQQVVATETARAARAEPQSDAPGLRPRLLIGDAAARPYREAAPRGVAIRPTPLGQAMDALRADPSQVSLAALSQWVEPGATAEGPLGHAAPPPAPAKPVGIVAKGNVDAGVVARDRASLGRSAAADIAMLEPAVGGSQLLTLSPGRIARPEAPIMPIPGQVVTGFGDSAGGRDKAAIRIAAAPGQAVAAPADGRVVFAGTFRSYGLLLIIQHDPEYHTLLWGISRIDVGVGEEVRIGQLVGAMGVDGGRGPELHVELRRHGRPVNPLPWLAASSNKVRG